MIWRDQYTIRQHVDLTLPGQPGSDWTSRPGNVDPSSWMNKHSHRHLLSSMLRCATNPVRMSLVTEELLTIDRSCRLPAATMTTYGSERVNRELHGCCGRQYLPYISTYDVQLPIVGTPKTERARWTNGNMNDFRFHIEEAATRIHDIWIS